MSDATEIADAVVSTLQVAGLVFTIPPGRCGDPCFFARALSCELRAGHAGQHEARNWEGMPPGMLAQPPMAYWDGIVDAEVVEPEEVLVEGDWIPRDALPDVLGRYMRSQRDDVHEIKRLTLHLEQLSAIIAEHETHPSPAVRGFVDQLRAAMITDGPDVTQ